MNGLLRIGLSSWIIQDGNYKDFEAGKSSKFALEFFPKTIKKTADGALGCKYLDGGLYQLTSKVKFASKQCYVIDFGLLAYDEIEKGLTPQEGELYEIEGYLGVDPFFYYEDFSRIANMPALIYEWRVRTIFLETTPWIEKVANGRKIMARDSSNLSYREIGKTDAWKDDNGNASYLLEVELLNPQPFLTR